MAVYNLSFACYWLSVKNIISAPFHTKFVGFFSSLEAMLVKVKGMHYMSAPSFMDRFMMIIKPFMKKELLEVLKIHQIGSKTLEQYMPMDGLPKDAGGKYNSYEECKEETKALLKANKEFFVEENKKRVVEALRPGKPKTITDIFGGVEGSFKKLNID